MPSPTSHFKYAPSSSDRWIACPFSARDDLPRFETAAALEGTEGHMWGAKVLDNPEQQIDVPSHFADGVRMYTDHVLSNDATPMVERQLVSFEVPEHGGTIDCLLVENRHCVVYDYKNGRWPVNAKDNSQLLCYAGIADEHFEIDIFHGVIVQPNAFKGPKTKTAAYDRQQVDGHRLKVIAATQSDEKQTGDHCRWCPLRLTDQCDEGVKYGRAKGW